MNKKELESRKDYFAARGVNALVAEDNVANIPVLQKYFQIWGVNYTLVRNGVEVIKALQKENYDLILMDLLMPKLDGVETAYLIRGFSEEEIREIPIIGFTPSPKNFFHERLKKANFDALLVKPFNPEELLQKIRTYSHKEAF